MKKVLIFLTLIWIAFIFYNSSVRGELSQKKSCSIAKIISENHIANKVVSLKNKSIKSIDYRVRKSAHFFEYLILAILLFINFLYAFKGKNPLIYILFICLLLAVLDEFYQSFTPNRSSRVADILIDFSGSTAGICISYLIYCLTIPYIEYKNNK